jgi:hypothetical protein
VEAVVREAARAHLYPDGSGMAVRQALGRRLGVSPEAIMLGNGADELLDLIAWAAFEVGDEVVIPYPSFEPYGTVVTLSGATPVWSPLANYQTDLADMAKRVTPRTKALILCSPHNPTGTIIRHEPLVKLLAGVGADPPLVILDEAFRGLERTRRQSLLARVREVFPKATLLCITHDVQDTLAVSRVLVLDGGKIVEDVVPKALQEKPSKYRDLLRAEAKVQSEIWSNPIWRRLLLREGRIEEETSSTKGPLQASEGAAWGSLSFDETKGDDRLREKRRKVSS